MKFLNILICVSICIQYSNAKVHLCDVETGQTNIILDIEESRGELTDQNTTPLELPIHGDPDNEISLELVYHKTEPVFKVIGKKLKLLKPLDRDKDNLSHIIFQVSCTVRSTDKNRNIPIIVRVSDVNDNAPIFVNTPYEVTVPEATPIGSTIFRNILATDKDAGVNGLVEYFLINSTEKLPHYDNSSINIADGYDVFAINFPHQGQVTVAKTLDFERVQRYYLTVVVSDRARNSNERLSATTTLVVNIADSDDLDPSFIYRGCVSLDGACINPEYSATIPQGTLQGVLNIHPERIQAVDLDKMSLPIKYSFINGNPNTYDDYFEIDKQTGSVSQKKLVDSSVTARQFEIIVQAEEVSEARRTATAKLTINVKPVDSFPPTIRASAIEGFVDEHSPVGTKVLDSNGNQIKFITTDADILEDDLLPEYSYELTTPSFRIDKDGLLVVNDVNLDCDPPNLPNLRFQVVAREVKGNAASTPMSISVNLNDINDNSPKLTFIAPVELSAGNEKRLIAKANATDIDRSTENAAVIYSIHHVSNNGMKKFTIDPKTGEIYTQSKLIAGEHYSITVQASDIGNLYSRSIVEVNIIPGPNKKPPKFVKSVYDVQVKENVELNSTIVTVQAEDPESEQVHYALISGNDLRQFAIATKSGMITVIRKLDREQITRYQLIIRADDNGGLSSTATVNIKVDDINDNNPKFDETMMPFIFSVDEGQKNRIVGIVRAYDNDEGVNAKISYSISESVPFVIEQETGEIRTKEELDYEKQKSYEFIVTAKDSAIDVRSSTATVIVKVKDIADEVPKFNESAIYVKVPENIPNLFIATVKAFDPDTVPEINYKIISGGSNLFKIDPKTGEVRTTQGLDYENEKEISLVIGTMENSGRASGDTIEIRISIEDQNDNAPVFASSSETITISDEIQPGAEIITMSAIDADGTSPANSIQYEIIGRGKAMKYFKIDQITGEITSIREFKNDSNSEFQLDVRAHDLGEPQLSSVSSVVIYVKKSADVMNGDAASTNSNSDGIAFNDIKFTLTIPEMSAVNTTLKIMQISKINNKDFKCEIVSEHGDTFGILMQKSSCDLVLLSPLDYEKKSTHKVEVKLSSMKARVNPLKNIAIVEIMVQNQNDNSPYFKMPHIQSGRNDTIYRIVEENTLMNAVLMQVKATDLDADVYGMIKYRIMDEHGANSFFTINEDNGIIKTRKPIEEIQKRPIRFIVEARDNNGVENESTRRSVVRVVINVISDINRMSLALSGSNLEDIMKHSNAIQNLLEKKTDLMVFIEKFSNRQEMMPNGNIVEVANATDVWFYVMDKNSELILDRNNSIVVKTFFEENAQNRIRADSSSVTRSKALGIFAPVENKRNNIHKTKAAVLIDENLLPLVLLIVSTTILILGTMGIIYICISWSRYDNFKKHMRHYSSNANNSTSYDPVIVNTRETDSPTSNSKQYETQVLGMNVNEDNDEHRQIGFANKSKSQTLRIEKRNYGAPKDLRRSPTNSETSTIVVGGGTSNRKNRINLLNNNINNKQNMMNKTIELNRNYTNHPSMDANMRGRTTLTLGRLKSERNQIINGYDDTLTRNNLTMARNNTFSTLGRNRNNNDRQNYSNLGLNNLGFEDSRYESAFSQKYRFNAVLPVTDSVFNRHQNFGRTPCETDENVFFGSNLDYSNYDIPFDLDRSEQETTTEL